MVTNFAFPHSSLCWSPYLNLNYGNWPSNSTFSDRLRNAQVSQYVKLIMQDHAGSIIMGISYLWRFFDKCIYILYFYSFYDIFVDYTQTYYIWHSYCVCLPIVWPPDPFRSIPPRRGVGTLQRWGRWKVKVVVRTGATRLGRGWPTPQLGAPTKIEI